MRIASIKTSFFALCALLAPGGAGAQSYPERPIRMVVPFAAGSPLDIVARTLAEGISGRAKWTFVIENRPGAGGNLGADAIARATPDGYVLGMMLDTVLTANPSLYKTIPFEPRRDFRVVSLVAASGQMLVVHPSLPVKSVGEFLDHARASAARKEPLIYGSGGGIGTPGHLTMESFRQRMAFDAVHLPYQGNPAMVMGLTTGDIKVGFVNSSGVLEHVKSGKLRALAVSHSTRSPLAPDVPTIAEAGVPGFSVGFHQVLVAPRNIPAGIVAAIEREVARVIAAPDFVARLAAMDLSPSGVAGEDAEARLEAARRHWSDVVAKGHLRVE